MVRPLLLLLVTACATACATTAPTPTPPTTAEQEPQKEKEQEQPPPPLPAPPPPAAGSLADLWRRAGEGDRSLDLRALRLQWLDEVGDPPDVHEQRAHMLAAARRGDHARARAIAEEILVVDPINLWAHKIRRQACRALEDLPCAEHGDWLGLGLLRTVTADVGDGASCETAWEVVRIDEEYFVIAMLGARLQTQSLVQGAGGELCDRMDIVDEEGHEASVFFDVRRVMMARQKRLGL